MTKRQRNNVPTHGDYMAWLSTLHDPVNGRTTVTTDRFFVPGGIGHLIFDYHFMGTLISGNVNDHLDVGVLQDETLTLFDGVFSDAPPAIIEANISGFALGTGVQSAAGDLTAYAGQEIPIRIVFILKGSGPLPASRPGLRPDDDNPLGFPDRRGAALLLDNLRLSGSSALPAAPDIDALIINPPVDGFSVISGPADAVAPLSTVFFKGTQKAGRLEVTAAEDGSFSLAVPVLNEASTHYVLNYGTADTNPDNTSNRLFSPNITIRIDNE